MMMFTEFRCWKVCEQISNDYLIFTVQQELIEPGILVWEDNYEENYLF